MLRSAERNCWSLSLPFRGCFLKGKNKKKKDWPAAKLWRHINIPGLCQHGCRSSSSSSLLRMCGIHQGDGFFGSVSQPPPSFPLLSRMRSFLNAKQGWAQRAALRTRALDHSDSFHLLLSFRESSSYRSHVWEPAGQLERRQPAWCSAAPAPHRR